MFWWILTACISAINTIVYKKLLVINTQNKISSIGLYGYMCLIVVLIIGIIYVVYPSSITIDFSQIYTSFFTIWGIFLFSVFWMIANIPAQIAYRQEKISVLTPFAETGRIITLILGFFLFANTSLVTFSFALVSAFVLVWASINFKSFAINKYCLFILLTWVIQSINTIIAGYIILKLSTFSFIFGVNIIAVCITLFYMLSFKRWELVTIPSQTTRPLLGMLTLNNLLWLVSYTITLYLMKELGIVMTSLLGMITMILTILSSYIFFRDIPTRKDIIVACIIMLCVGGGTILQ